jgi:hypothetical protein
VESVARARDNPAKFNMMIRIALFLCNGAKEVACAEEKFSWKVMEITELRVERQRMVGEKF